MWWGYLEEFIRWRGVLRGFQCSFREYLKTFIRWRWALRGFRVSCGRGLEVLVHWGGTLKNFPNGAVLFGSFRSPVKGTSKNSPAGLRHLGGLCSLGGYLKTFPRRRATPELGLARKCCRCIADCVYFFTHLQHNYKKIVYKKMFGMSEGVYLVRY